MITVVSLVRHGSFIPERTMNVKRAAMTIGGADDRAIREVDSSETRKPVSRETDLDEDFNRLGVLGLF